jgi:uncharacterized membrane protein YqiK
MQPRRAVRLAVTATVALIVAIVALTTATGAYAKSGQGTVAVVRNGGPFDNTSIRQVIRPNSGLTYIGLKSTVHRYPASQRFYTITGDVRRGDKTGVDVEQVPTSDGVEVGIEGTIYFTLDISDKTIRDFDNKFGTRTFTCNGNSYYAWEGDEGWRCFLDAIARPVISNDFRATIGDFRCQELQAACALVQNNGNNSNIQKVITGGNNVANFNKVQSALTSSLEQDITDSLGAPFLKVDRIILAKLTLPQTLQDAILSAQAAYADITRAQATIAKAQAEADANRRRQAGYNACPVCGQIDLYKAIPPTITTFAPGSGFGITQPK